MSKAYNYMAINAPYYKLNRSVKYNVTGLAEGVRKFIDSKYKGLIITQSNTHTFILIRPEDVTPQAGKYGDKTLLNYLASIGELISTKEVDELQQSEDLYMSVTLHPMT